MRKFTALLLSFILIFPSFQLNTVKAQDDSGHKYIPLRNAAENNGGSVTWDTESQSAILHYEGSQYHFKNTYTTAIKDGREINLKMPALVRDGVMHVYYDDIAFLYEEENEQYSAAKQAAVTTAYAFMEAYQIPGITLSFVDGETGFEWVQGFGYANIEAEELIDGDTVFSLASISKVFTAVSVMQLVEQGVLSLNEKVSKYLPDFKINPHPVYGGDYKDITVGMLLSHFSGIPGDTFRAFYTKNTYHKDYMNHFLEDLSTQYMDNVSLDMMNYANNGYVLLGVLVASMAGYDSPYDGFIEYTEKNIFAPLGMKHSSFKLDDRLQLYLASAYPNASAPIADHLICNALPAGGLYSSANDMAKFMSAMLNDGVYDGQRILRAETIKDMMRPSEYNNELNPQMTMGLGFYQTKYNDFVMTGHGGDILNFHSDMQLSPETYLGVFASANSDSSAGIMPSLTAIILKAAAEAKTGNSWPAPITGPSYVMELTAEELSAYTGYYTALGSISATPQNTLMLDNYELELIPQDDGSFKGEGFGKLWFKEIKGYHCVFFGNRLDSYMGMKITPQKADLDFQKYVGVYKEATNIPGNESIVTQITLAVDENGYPVVSFDINDGQNSGQLMLLKFSDSTYYIAGKGRNFGKVVDFYTLYNIGYMDFFGATFMKID